MVQAEGPREGDAFDRLLTRRVEVDWVLVAYFVIFAAAFGLRFWDLGARALHHDESIHAKWAWDFAQGSYRHSPTFHGPFLYLAQGFTFVVFTATDYTSRISPALFGMAVVAAPLALRRWLGSTGALAAVAFIAFSPTLVYFSRFLRMDIYLAAFILAMVVALWSYLHTGKTRWLIIFAVALSLAFSTKEAAFLFVAFLLLYLNGHLALDLVTATLRTRGANTPSRRLAYAAVIYPIAWLLAALWPFLSRVRLHLGWSHLPRTGDLLVLVGTLTLPLLTPFAKNVLEAVFAGTVLDYPAVCSTPNVQEASVLAASFGCFFGVAAVAGLSWRPRVWLISTFAAVLIYSTLMTSLWTNLDGLCTGAWGSIDYWQAQQEVRRGMQPWFYYLMLMPAYEFLPLLIALAGGAWALFRGSAFSRFLVLWLVVLFLAFSFAGEKMPWLNTHLAIPTILIAAWSVQRAWVYWKPSRFDGGDLITVCVVLAMTTGTLMLLVFDWGPTLWVRFAWGCAPLVVTLVTVRLVSLRLGPRILPALAIAVVISGFTFFSLRTMVDVTFARGDIPKDLLIYTQSSPEITQLADDIDALSSATGMGLDLRIAVDAHASFAWPWVWYLRDYRNVTFSNMESGLPAGAFDVVLVNAANLDVVSRDLADRGVTEFAPPTQYPHRWWFPETYKVSMSGCMGRDSEARFCEPYMAETWRRIGKGFFGGSWAHDAFAYWRDREPRQQLGSIDGFAYFPLGFDRISGKLSSNIFELAEPGVDRAGRPTFGGLGSRKGQFAVPVDIELGPENSLYVTDRMGALLQKFYGDGNFLGSSNLHGLSDGPGQPWGLAVSGDGVVYVADTFGWRIIAFDADLRHQKLEFGNKPLFDGEPPGPYELYGPRDLAIDLRGNLWVTDTGHGRIVVYSSGGEFQFQIAGPFSQETFHRGSGPAQFNEPVGIDVAPNGEIVIADMWNARVQILDASGTYLREFPVVGWGGLDALDKPYLQVLRDGRIALSLPSLGQVRIYSSTGVLLSTIAPSEEPLLLPYGIAESPGGKLWVVESGAARVRLFDSALARER